MAGSFRLTALPPGADRSGFQSGVPELDRYFAERVGQDMRRRVAACFVARDAAERIAGFYTLAAASVELSDLPDVLKKKLPRYPTVPAVRLGRLAVDASYHGRGLGAALLADALQRAATADIAAYALIVDAKDDKAARFHRHHGFQAFASRPLVLFLPLATVTSLLG